MELDIGMSESLDHGFTNLENKANLLIPILQKYKYEDLAVAIFAITSWRDNRSAQESCLSLNSALIQCDIFGNKSIATYRELADFFNEIEPILKITHLDDSVVNDFGEVRLSYNKMFYPVITGTGHTGIVYAALQYLEAISLETGCQLQSEAVLQYTKAMIDSLRPTNVSRYDIPKIVFEIPVDDYFQSVKKWCAPSSIEMLDDDSVQSFTDPTQSILKTHFVQKDSVVFPLFNPSLVLDHYIKLMAIATPKNIEDHIHAALFKRMKAIHVSTSEKVEDYLLYKPQIAVDEKIVSANEPTFLYVNRDNVVLLIDVEQMESTEVAAYLEQINDVHSQDKLGFVDLSAPVGKRQFWAIKVPQKQPLKIILFNRYTNLDEPYIQFGGKDEQLIITAIDLMFMLSMTDDMEELFSFFTYHKQEQAQVFSWGGISDTFSLWKQEQGHISKGAENYDMIYTDFETSCAYIVGLYTQWQNCFPFHLENQYMGIPEQWKIVLDENGIYQFAKKCLDPQGGAGIILENDGFIFCSYDFFKIMENQNTQDVRMWQDLVSGLNERCIMEHKSALGEIDLFNKTHVNIQCTSLNTTHGDSIYVNIDSFSKKKNTIEINYTVDCKKLIQDISNSGNREIESLYLLQLFAPIFIEIPAETQAIKDSIIKASDKSKTVNTKAQKLDYYVNTDYLPLRLKDECLLAARKTIAVIAAENGIQPGKYQRKTATAIVRNMQESLVKYLEDSILEYDYLMLHTILLHYYATELFGSYINHEGYSLTSEVDVSMQQRNKEKLISARKENKEMQSSLQYLIETNLFLTDKRGGRNPKISDIEDLVAFSHWLGILQSHSDMCFHTTSDTHFIVLDDYRVNVELGEDYQSLINQTETRTYESGRYAIQGDDEDKENFDAVSKGFLRDTGVDFQVLEVVLRQLMECAFPKEQVSYDEIKPNVIRINKEDAIRDIQSFVVENISEDKVQKAYDFITISPGKLKTIGDVQHNILPVWEREKRNNRFDVTPLLSVGDSYIYSPAAIKELHSRWVHGWLQFYPPYEIGLNAALDALWKWKERYEHLFSSDVCAAFREKDYAFAESDVDIRRRDRTGGHPSIDILGDYDVIALDTSGKRVFIIECKVLQPVGSVFEHSMQQKRFFLEDKYDEKFQRRVDYFKLNYRVFFNNLGFSLIDEEYSIEAFMVVNKVFDSFYKKIDFPIVTFDELLKII